MLTPTSQGFPGGRNTSLFCHPSKKGSFQWRGEPANALSFYGIPPYFKRSAKICGIPQLALSP